MTAISNIPALTVCKDCGRLTLCRHLPYEGWLCKPCMEKPW